MANYYTHLSFAIQATPEQAEFFQKIAAYFETAFDAVDGDERAPPAPEGLEDIVAPLWAQYGDTMTGTGCDSTYEDGSLSVYDDAGEANLELLADIIGAMVERYQMPPVSFEWATTCSRPRIGAFGGGAVVITKDGTHWLNTGTWITEKEKVKLSMPTAADSPTAGLEVAHLKALLSDALSFIAGFEGDETQDEPVDPLCNKIRDVLGDEPQPRPKLAIICEGGIIQDIVSDQPEYFAGVQIMTIDYDDDGSGTYLIPQLDGSPNETAHVCEDYGVSPTKKEFFDGIREQTPEEMGAV